MRLQRQLNIDNTYRVLNLNFFKLDWKHIIKVTPANKEKVLQSLNDNQGADYTYLLNPAISTDLLLNHKVYRSEGKIIYYSEGMIPTSVFLDVGTNRKSIYVYKLQDFDQPLLQNMNKASIVGTTAVYAPHVTKDLDPYKLIFTMNDARFIADRLYLDFEPNTKAEDEESIFDELHEILARWTIQLFLSYDDPEAMKALKTKIINKYK